MNLYNIELFLSGHHCKADASLRQTKPSQNIPAYKTMICWLVDTNLPYKPLDLLLEYILRGLWTLSIWLVMAKFQLSVFYGGHLLKEVRQVELFPRVNTKERFDCISCNSLIKYQ